eukprot:TRINITY_DN2432_c0_g1_i1.p1 TRINITY_DN2432_c0_g1~~TRINITY_DN2432_c0_g1_i1.p1  ORF type:complete len:340 (+),score=31.52 TRINITY_DN2432_c0_g1_i1:1235-2254(+)
MQADQYAHYYLENLQQQFQQTTPQIEVREVAQPSYGYQNQYYANNQFYGAQPQATQPQAQPALQVANANPTLTTTNGSQGTETNAQWGTMVQAPGTTNQAQAIAGQPAQTVLSQPTSTPKTTATANASAANKKPLDEKAKRKQIETDLKRWEREQAMRSMENAETQPQAADSQFEITFIQAKNTEATKISAATPDKSNEKKDASQAAICYICKRKLPNAEALQKHELFSDLHKQNVEKLKAGGIQIILYSFYIFIIFVMIIIIINCCTECVSGSVISIHCRGVHHVSVFRSAAKMYRTFCSKFFWLQTRVHFQFFLLGFLALKSVSRKRKVQQLSLIHI